MTSADLIFESERELNVLVLIYSKISFYFYRNKNSFPKSYMKNNRYLLRGQILAQLYFTEAKAVQEWMDLAQRKMASSPLLEASRCLLHYLY